MNKSPLPTSDSGSGKVSSTSCSAVIGPPAAMRPTSGINLVLATGAPLLFSGVSSSARPLLSSRRMKPFSSKISSWYLTEAVDVRPTAAPISRMVGA